MTTPRPLQILDRGASAEEVCVALAADGGVIIERLVEPAVMDRIKSEVEPYLEATAPGADDFSGHRTRRTGALHRPVADVSATSPPTRS